MENNCVSFIILTWNSKKLIKNCIQSYANILGKENLTAEFWIIDNGSDDKTTDYIKQELVPEFKGSYEIHIISLDKNYGTTFSRNLALKKTVGKYIVICDSDTAFYGGSLRTALEYMKRDEKTGLIAPLLVWPDMKPQPSVRKFPTLIDKLSKIGNILFNLPIGNNDLYNNLSKTEIIPVETAASAFWILKRETIETVGFLDEKIFYAPEDIDYCLRIWKNGYRVMYMPELVINHFAQRISRSKPFSKIALSHLKGLLYYFYKHRYFLSRARIKQYYAPSFQKQN
ncbi:glycosyltransferase [candidate division KSB1 bacterium]|nr:glycosyltransferase [candidate division KSB1 bacterium]